MPSYSVVLNKCAGELTVLFIVISSCPAVEAGGLARYQTSDCVFDVPPGEVMVTVK